MRSDMTFLRRAAATAAVLLLALSMSATAQKPSNAKPSKKAVAALASGLESYAVLDFGAAGPLFRQACDGNVGQACDELARMMELRRYLPSTPKDITDQYVRGCDLGYGRSCGSLALFHDAGMMGVVWDKAIGGAYRERACDLGSGGACWIIGDRYFDGVGFEQDYVKANTYFARACEANDPDGCAALSGSYVYGTGSEKNEDKARELIKKAYELQPDNEDIIAAARRLFK